MTKFRLVITIAGEKDEIANNYSHGDFRMLF